jgi:hypothetical protein
VDQAMLASELIFAAKNQGGGTFTRSATYFSGKNGFVVGGIVPSLVIEPSAITIEAVERTEEWIERNRSARYYGSWNDAGTIHIDAVDIIEDREEAIRLAEERGELAIYDLAADEEVRVA